MTIPDYQAMMLPVLKLFANGAENVSRPAIQQFVGSLNGEGATKGVFVTTSDFSAEAKAGWGSW